jgi:hypothetical protein
MVFGIGEGKIEIETDKQSYSAGEKVKGKVRLTLNQPKKAKGLRLKFYGERRVQNVSMGSRGGTSTRIVQEYPQEITLGGEKEYPAGMTECDFEFTLPSPQRAAPQGDNPLAGVFGMLVGDPWANVVWYLDASLDLPMSLDINKKMQISFAF